MIKILVAEDDGMTRLALTRNIEKWGYEVVAVSDGLKAYAELSGENSPRVALLDWLMPGMKGVEICTKDRPLIYTILLTIKKDKSDIVRALDHAACDFLSKPVHMGELRSRIAVGVRLIEAEDKLFHHAREIEIKNKELENALAEIKTLKGILPICANCKKIRDDAGYWNLIEEYIAKRSDAEFTHGICPECMDELYGDQAWYQKQKAAEEK